MYPGENFPGFNHSEVSNHVPGIHQNSAKLHFTGRQMRTPFSKQAFIAFVLRTKTTFTAHPSLNLPNTLAV